MSGYRISFEHSYAPRREHVLYNTAMSSIVDDLFETETIGPEGYIPVGKYNLEDLRAFLPIDEYNDAENTWNSAAETFEFFPTSEYENRVANLILYGNFPIYVLSGGMGTGKSSVSKTILAKMREHYSHTDGHCFLEAKFDFNGESNDKLDPVLLFRQKLFNQLKAQLDLYLRSNFQAIVDFVNQANREDNSNDFADFYDYYSKAFANPSWMDQSSPQRISELFGFITASSGSLELLITFLKYLKKRYENGVFFIILIDNIDRCSPGTQFLILQHIFPLFYQSKIKCLVPLRRATFKRNKKKLRLNDQMDGSYSYGFIGHSSISPIVKIQKRLLYLHNNFDKLQTLKFVSAEYREALFKRIQNVRKYLEDDNSLLSKFIIALSGRSSRIALSLMERLFINNVVDFNSDFNFTDLSMKALMIKANADFRFNNAKEDEILNLFTYKELSDDFSLIPFFLLQLIHEHGADPSKRQLRFLLREIGSINSRWKKSDILHAINMLIHVKRPIIWSDEKSFYDPDVILEDDMDDVFYITEIGNGYYDYLIRSNTQYLQECFMSLRWRHNYVPRSFDTKSFKQRFSVLRDCVKEVLAEEKSIQIKNYTPLSRLVYQTIFGSFLSIINYDIDRYLQSPDIFAELEDWVSLGAELDNRYRTLESCTAKINHFYAVLRKFEHYHRS